jgi:hypothetical protein
MAPSVATLRNVTGWPDPSSLAMVSWARAMVAARREAAAWMR